MCLAPSERLKRLSKNAGCNDSKVIKLVDEFVENCKSRRKYKKFFLKPAVAFPVAEGFNEIVCMDLKEIQKGGLWFLYMIDGATKYTVAVLIDTKNSEVVVYRICQCQIAYFGFPKKLHSDCGGEFCNEVLREMIDIETNTTTLQVKLLSVMGLWRETIKLCMSL